MYFAVNEKADAERTVIGFATTDTLIRVAETLLDKPGGYLSNDVTPPSVILDNMPNWELGVVQQVRDLARVTRNDYSRSQSQSREDEDLTLAEPKFSLTTSRGSCRRRNRSIAKPLMDSSATATVFPASAVAVATTRCFSPERTIFANGLRRSKKRLGSLTRRLGDSVATSCQYRSRRRCCRTSSSNLQDNVTVRTSWFEIDDVFFEARGASWALVHFFRAAQFDFADVLADKNAEASVRQIIRELEASLAPLRSPMVMNGGGFGFFANHSLVMANYLARANAAVINLRELLDQG